MQLMAENRLAITELVALHGHLFDEGELDRLGDLSTPDVVYDASDFGQESMHGIDSIRLGALALGDRNPWHTTSATSLSRLLMAETSSGKWRGSAQHYVAGVAMA